MNVSHILAATDLSESSDEGLRQAHAWAKLWNASLTVCHVVRVAPAVSPLFPQVQRELLEELPDMLSKAAALVRERVEKITGRKDDEYQLALGEGSPPTGILEEAERVKADLIVLASAGHSAAGSWLLGSVAEEVVRGSHCPVLVARPSPASRSVLGAVELGEGSERIADGTLELAARMDGDATLLHVLFLEDVFSSRLGLLAGGPVPMLPPDTHAELQQISEQRLQGLISGAKTPARIQVVEGAPAAEILRVAKERNAGVVVVAALGVRRKRRAILGRVAARVIRAAPCSVLTLRVS